MWEKNFIDRKSIVGPSFSGETGLIKKKLNCCFKGSFFIITWSLVRYNHQFITEEQIREISEDEVSTVVFDDKLDTNQTAKVPIFKRGRHEDLDVSQLAQSDFDLPKKR